jgi:hypothetical protein
MKRITTILFSLVIMCMGSLANAQTDTTHVVDGFTLEEQSITLKVGESYQLHVSPADAKIRWMESMHPLDNYVTVDMNGLVTALKPTSANTIMGGITTVGAESLDGSVSKLCKVTVLDEGSILKDKKSFAPVDECEWTEAKFTLDNNGHFKAEGAYYGSGAQTNHLNYIVTDQCIYLWFEINYEDSTKMFYPQPFSLEIENCNAQEYNIYFRNKTHVLDSQDKFVQYAIRRGFSTGGTTNAESIAASITETTVEYYNLSGQKIDSPSGLTIVVTRYSDGSIRTEKKLLR